MKKEGRLGVPSLRATRRWEQQRLTCTHTRRNTRDYARTRTGDVYGKQRGQGEGERDALEKIPSMRHKHRTKRRGGGRQDGKSTLTHAHRCTNVEDARGRAVVVAEAAHGQGRGTTRADVRIGLTRGRRVCTCIYERAREGDRQGAQKKTIDNICHHADVCTSTQPAGGGGG